LGGIVISGDNPADVKAILDVIKALQEIAKGTEIRIELIRLEHADATSVSNTLSQVFQRVFVGASGNVRAPGTPTTGVTSPFITPQQPRTAQAAGSVVLLPLPRYNAILVAAPGVRMDDITKEIKKLDLPTGPQGQATPFPLKKASAAQAETFITNF